MDSEKVFFFFRKRMCMYIIKARALEFILAEDYVLLFASFRNSVLLGDFI
jgi:hypothetical protein